MKKLLMYGMAAALLAGCSSTDDDVLSPEASSEDINATVDISKLMSDVPIEFGTFGGEAYTRGSIDGTIDQTIEDVRVFCLARAAIKGQNKTASWAVDTTATTQTENVTLSVWQNNVKARIEPAETLGYGNLIWTDPTEPHFYPSKEWYAYDFVACHPAPDSIIYTKNSLLLYFRFNDNNDVMAAKSTLPEKDSDLAYSSSYFKEVANAATPFFAFKHMGAKLVFKFQLKEARSTNLYVDSVAILDYPNMARLYVQHEGTQVTMRDTLVLTARTTPGNGPEVKQRGNYYLRESNGSSIRTKAGQYLVDDTEAVIVGDCIIIPPGSTESPKLWVWMKDDDGHSFATTNAITINRPAGGWVGGKQYNVTVKLNNPRLIGARGIIESAWTDNVEDIEISE